MLINLDEGLNLGKIPVRKTMKKLGTVKISTVETTPVVWGDKLLRFEWVRNSEWGKNGGVTRKVGCYHFVDMADESSLGEFADDHSFGCCIAEGGKMFVHGVRGGGGGNVLDTFVSSDLKNWEQSVALTFPEDVRLYNTSVCKGTDGYIMAIEIGGKNPIVGNAFTNIFARSDDLVNWTLLDPEKHCYTRERYSACPCIRYFDGYYYIIYLEGAPLERWLPYIVRSRDLVDFEAGLTNPIFWPDADDKKVINPERFTPEELHYIANAVDCNNSDFDMCEFEGKTVITYSWGNQHGKEFLALAEYDGTNEEFLKSFFE